MRDGIKGMTKERTIEVIEKVAEGHGFADRNLDRLSQSHVQTLADLLLDVWEREPETIPADLLDLVRIATQPNNPIGTAPSAATVTAEASTPGEGGSALDDSVKESIEQLVEAQKATSEQIDKLPERLSEALARVIKPPPTPPSSSLQTLEEKIESMTSDLKQRIDEAIKANPSMLEADLAKNKAQEAKETANEAQKTADEAKQTAKHAKGTGLWQRVKEAWNSDEG